MLMGGGSTLVGGGSMLVGGGTMLVGGWSMVVDGGSMLLGGGSMLVGGGAVLVSNKASGGVLIPGLCVLQELLYNKHLYMDGTKIEQTGFTYHYPELHLTCLRQVGGLRTL